MIKIELKKKAEYCFKKNNEIWLNKLKGLKINSP